MAALAHHLVRIALAALVFAACPFAAPLAAVALYFASFMLAHELAHGALGLPRRANNAALAVGGLCALTAGHAMRITHMRHHARPFADDDLEGAAAHLPALHAFAIAPWLALRLVGAAWRHAPRRDRAWQLLEYAAIALIPTLVPALRIYAIVAFAGQLLAPFWAGYLIHRPPRWLTIIGTLAARAGSLTAKTLVLHEAHHARPKLPTLALEARATDDARAAGRGIASRVPRMDQRALA